MGTQSRSTNNIKLLESAAKIFNASANLGVAAEIEDNPGEQLLLDRIHACCPNIRRDNGDLILAEKNPSINAALVEAMEAEQRDFPTKLVGFMTGFAKVTKGSFIGKMLANKQLDPAAAFMVPTTIFPKGQNEHTGAKVIDAGTLIIIKDFISEDKEKICKKREKFKKILDDKIKLYETKMLDAKTDVAECVVDLKTVKIQRMLLEANRAVIQDMARTPEESAKMILAHEYCHAMLSNQWMPDYQEGMSSREWQEAAAAALMDKKLHLLDKHGFKLILEVPPVTIYGTTDIEEGICDMYALARYRPDMLGEKHHNVLAEIFGKPIPPA